MENEKTCIKCKKILVGKEKVVCKRCALGARNATYAVGGTVAGVAGTVFLGDKAGEIMEAVRDIGDKS